MKGLEGEESGGGLCPALLTARLATLDIPGCQLHLRPCCKPHEPTLAWVALFQSEISCVPEKEECYTGKGLDYRGTRSLTMSGAFCLPWNSLVLMGKIYTAWNSNAQTLGLGKHNYCRCAAQNPRRLRRAGRPRRGGASVQAWGFGAGAGPLRRGGASA